MISLGTKQVVEKVDHLAGLGALALEDEPTLIVMPDLSAMAPADPTDADQVTAVRATYHSVLVAAMAQCAQLGDRFLIGEIWRGDQIVFKNNNAIPTLHDF